MPVDGCVCVWICVFSGPASGDVMVAVGSSNPCSTSPMRYGPPIEGMEDVSPPLFVQLWIRIQYRPERVLPRSAWPLIMTYSPSNWSGGGSSPSSRHSGRCPFRK
ncbi:hypothetical protein F5888DRAFT_557709 [Russula emetica]|nr:hypothetical protein F5888DRAFT_557709 [Russula emetica]